MCRYCHNLAFYVATYYISLQHTTMSLAKPILVVLGATGTQGGSVLAHFLSLSPSPYALRGVTRDLSSAKAAALIAQGVEMVVGNFDDPTSLEAAFKGASAIYSVTDYWNPMADPLQHQKAAAAGQSIGHFIREYETQQNKNIIDAAANLDGLERFIFSSLPDTKKLSSGKYTHVFQFDSKGIAEEYGRQTHPKLWAKTSVFYAPFYLENYFGPLGALFRPKLDKSKGSLTLAIAEPLASTPLPWFSAVGDTGALVYALLRAAPGKKLIGVRELLSPRQLAELFAETLEKGIEFIGHVSSSGSDDSDITKGLADLMGWCVEFGYDGAKVDQNIVTPEDLGVPVALGSVKEWFQKQDWDQFLQLS
ncbi:putative hscarg dehydrogenase [Trichoderma evansii]